MDKADRFLRQHDVIAICGCFRFGSTALANTLARFASDHGHPVTYLNEFFAGHHYLAQGSDGQPRAMTLPVDYIESDGAHPNIRATMQRPMPEHLFRARLEWLRCNMGSSKMVLKIDPADWEGPNGIALERFILGDPRVYAIGLNRADVGNAVISFLIGRHFNVWNMDSAGTAAENGRDVAPVEADLGLVQEMYDAILAHNNWLWCMRDRLDAMVWFDQVGDPCIPDMGMVNGTGTWTARNHMPHDQRARRYFTNHDVVVRICRDVQANLDGLIESVRQRYDGAR